jgi:hypothetical protein
MSVTDFSGQPIGPIFKSQALFGQEVQDGLTLEEGPIGCAKKSVVTRYNSKLRKITEEGRSRFTPRLKPAVTQFLCEYLASSTSKTNIVLEGVT